jgi:hypothetical protein
MGMKMNRRSSSLHIFQPHLVCKRTGASESAETAQTTHHHDDEYGNPCSKFYTTDCLEPFDGGHFDWWFSLHSAESKTSLLSIAPSTLTRILFPSPNLILSSAPFLLPPTDTQKKWRRKRKNLDDDREFLQRVICRIFLLLLLRIRLLFILSFSWRIIALVSTISFFFVYSPVPFILVIDSVALDRDRSLCLEDEPNSVICNECTHERNPL